MVAPDTLGPGGQVCNFPIPPGKHTQVVRLPEENIDRAHFYVHVSGEPDWRNVPDFSETLGRDGTLEFRPDNFVPVRVPIFDEEKTNEQTNNLRLQLRAAQTALDDARNDPFASPETVAELEQALGEASGRFESRRPAYRWVYRPEAQFTAFDLEAVADEVEHAGDTIDPDDANDFGNVSILYSLMGPDDDPLAVIGPPRELVFSLAGEEVVATLTPAGDNYGVAEFANPDHLNRIQADDLLVLRLIQNGDDANVLWEQSFCDFSIYIPEDEPYPIPLGESVQLMISPEDREVRWELLDKDKSTNVMAGLERDTGILTVDGDSGSGWIFVRAIDIDNPLCYREQRIWVGCESCRDCQKPGQCSVDLSCVDVRLGLGRGKDGRPAGELFLNSERLTANHGNAGTLVFSSPTRDAEALYGEDGAVRQVVAPRTFVDIVTQGDFGYEIRFYHPEARGDMMGDIYEVMPSAVPFSTVKIENPDASPDVFNRLRITENNGGNDIVSEYVQNGGVWTLGEGNGLRIVRHEETIAGDTKEVVRTVSDNTGHVASKTRLSYKRLETGFALTEEVRDPDGDALTTTYTYNEDPESRKYGKTETVLTPEGAQIRYEYDDLGRKTRELRPWLDTQLARVIEYDYSIYDPNDSNAEIDKQKPRMVTETVDGIAISRVHYSYRQNADGRTEITERCPNPNAGFGDSANIRTERTYYAKRTDAANAGKIKSVRHHDGRLATYTYEYGTFSYDADPAACVFAPGSGTDIRTEAVQGTVGHPDGIAFKTTKEVTVTDEFGNLLQTETLVYTGSGYERIGWEVRWLDDFGRATNVTRSDGTVSESMWNCCGKEYDRDETGIYTYYIYDDLNRVTTLTREGLNGDITTASVLDAEGRARFQTRSAGNLSLGTSNIYDLAGRPRSATDQANLTTAYDYAQGGLVSTVTRPGNITEITSRYLDGNTKSVSGSGVVASYNEYGVNPDGSQWSKNYAGSADNSSPMWQQTVTDTLGRTVRTERPGYDGVEVSQNHYDANGRLARTENPGIADTIYEYDELNVQIRNGLDTNGNGVLDLASNDRITESESVHVNIAGDWWRENVQRVYAAENDGTPTSIGTQKSRITGLGAGLVSESVTIDIHGNQTVSRAVIDRDAKTATTTTDHPDSTENEASTTTLGLLTSTHTKTGLDYDYVYDT